VRAASPAAPAAAHRRSYIRPAVSGAVRLIQVIDQVVVDPLQDLVRGPQVRAVSDDRTPRPGDQVAASPRMEAPAGTRVLLSLPVSAGNASDSALTVGLVSGTTEWFEAIASRSLSLYMLAFWMILHSRAAFRAGTFGPELAQVGAQPSAGGICTAVASDAVFTELIPCSSGLVVQGEDGLDDGGHAAGWAAGLAEDVPLPERGGATLSQGADLGVVPVE
jgi:hypothetical protein